MTDKFSVSVIIPAYKAADTIGCALQSVADQTCRPAEILVIDDGSNDNTAEVAESYRSAFDGCRFVVLLQSNQGPGAARNYGLREASCDLVAFLDADDEWFPKHLEVSVGKLFSNDLMLTAHNEMLMENGLESLNDSLARLRECVDPYVALYRKGCISTSTVICKRHAIVEVGGFDADLANGQDVDLWLAVLRQPGARFDIFEEPLSRYIIREGSVNSNISKRFYYFTKIARRWAGEIVVRRDGRMMDLWFRISAIHYEAFKGHSKNAAFIRAFLTCAMYPMNLFDITVRGLLKVTPGRPMSLYQPNPKA